MKETILTGNFNILLDSYAWIEFFIGSEQGKKVQKILEYYACFTSIVSIAEIIDWCLRNNKDPTDRIRRIKELSRLINLNEVIVTSAGKINFENKKTIKDWGMLDSFIYATALLYNLKVLTGDTHFKGLVNVEML